MDHADVIERLEAAAAEPRGLDRLLDGSSADSAAVAAHLADCESCRSELNALRHTRSVAAEVLQSTPSPELRERTLSYVAAVGRPRTAAAPLPVPSPVPAPVMAGPAASSTARRSSFRWPFLAWGTATFATGAAAAALVMALVLGQAYANGLRNTNAAIADQQRVVTALSSVTDWSMRLAADRDAETVRLTSPNGGDNVATVVYSSSAGEMVMVARTLPVPAANQEYRCWVESGGQRTLVGKMYFAGDLAYWVGRARTLPATDGNLTFGVSLVPIANTGLDGGMVVLTGSS